VTPAVFEKAQRLVAEERVAPFPQDKVFEVRGDHGTYLVVIGAGHLYCSCPAHCECSHIAAAGLMRLEKQNGRRATADRSRSNPREVPRASHRTD
jgi:hypothetical protein